MSVICKFESTHYSNKRKNIHAPRALVEVAGMNVQLLLRVKIPRLFEGKELWDKVLVEFVMDSKPKVYETKSGISFRASKLDSIVRIEKLEEPLIDLFNTIRTGKRSESETCQSDSKQVELDRAEEKELGLDLRDGKRLKTSQNETMPANPQSKIKVKETVLDRKPTMLAINSPSRVSDSQVESARKENRLIHGPNSYWSPKSLIPETNFYEKSMPCKLVLQAKNENYTNFGVESIKGLPNLGQTCYISAIVQMILNSQMCAGIVNTFHELNESMLGNTPQVLFLKELNEIVSRKKKMEKMSLAGLVGILPQINPRFKRREQQVV
jgi:hypothetical protein